MRERGRVRLGEFYTDESFFYIGLLFHCYDSLHWDDCLLLCGTDCPQMVNA